MSTVEGLSGLTEFAAVMNGLADAVTMKIGRKAVDQACQVTAACVAARTPRGDTQALARAVAYVVRVYLDDQRIAGVVGFDMDAPAPRATKGKSEGSKPPFLYGEWVEQGHRIRNKQTGKLKNRKGGVPVGNSPMVAPRPFFGPAVQMATPQALETMRKAYSDGIAAEIGNR